MNKKELKEIEAIFRALREKESRGEVFRDQGGVEPTDLVSIIKIRICKRIRCYKRSQGLQHKDLCKILGMTDSQISLLMAIQYDKFSLDLLVEKLDILSEHDEEFARAKEILKISC